MPRGPRKPKAQAYYTALWDPEDLPDTPEKWMHAQEEDPHTRAIIDKVMGEDANVTAAGYFVSEVGVLHKHGADKKPLIVVPRAVRRLLGIKPRKLVPYRPQGNPTERMNRNIKQCLRIFTEKHVNWDQYLCALSFGIRTAVNEATGYSAAKLTFGEELRSPFDPLENEQTGKPVKFEDRVVYDDFVKDLQVKLAEIVKSATKFSLEAHEKQRKVYDKGRIPHTFAVGDLVLKRTHVLSDAATKTAKSLSKPFDGPYEITAVIGENNVSLLDGNKKTAVANVDQIKPFFSPPKWATPNVRKIDPLELAETNDVSESNANTITERSESMLEIVDSIQTEVVPPPASFADIVQIDDRDEETLHCKPRREIRIPKHLDDYVLG
ncbi:hypothetical protein B566_EDAN012355 [Ephemera danica]|nr:hypothetical protein B566_EDAN012355 [Ephemera danica]